jgi:hypothetical protein
MPVYEIPLTPEPQTFNVRLVDKEYRFSLAWNAIANTWTLDIATVDNSTPLVQGIPVVTGSNLIGQFEHLGIGGELRARTDHDPDAIPTFGNLGAAGHLYLVTS